MDGIRSALIVASDSYTDPGLRRLLFVNWLLSSSWDVHSFAVPVLGHGRGYNASTIGLVLGTVVTMIFGEMVPKNLALAGPERAANQAGTMEAGARTLA